MQARLVDETNVPDLLAAAAAAAAAGVDAVVVGTGELGDAVTLASAIAVTTPRIGVGVLVNLTTQPHRHPTVMAREMTALDLVAGGRTILVFGAPFGEAVIEAVLLTRAMCTEGVAASDGPIYPVAGAINRPRPKSPSSPRLALDLSAGGAVDPELLRVVDLVLVPEGQTQSASLPAGVEQWQFGRS